MTAFYELRQYTVRPGKMAEFVDVMEKEVLPFQISKGAVITGLFRGETDDSVYVWLRRFESETERVRLYKEVYESDFWKNTMGPKIGTLIEREKNHVQRIVPTRLSTMQ
jgi:hypothetical protein